MNHRNGRITTRTCVICRERRQRSDLLRIIRTPEGKIEFDRTGRMDGRGAYVCGDGDHWGAKLLDGRLDRGRLKNALNIEIDDSTVMLLSEAINSHINE
jgi:predicted RNA-binding protein YlxR (DUF448 family)